MRTTVAVDDHIMRELKRQKDGRSLSRLVSDLLAQALGEQKNRDNGAPAPRWISKPMSARIDLTDQASVYAALEQEPNPTENSKSK